MFPRILPVIGITLEQSSSGRSAKTKGNALGVSLQSIVATDNSDCRARPMVSAADCLASSRGAGELRATAPGEEKRARIKNAEGKTRGRTPLVFGWRMSSVSLAVCKARACRSCLRWVCG